MSAEQRYIDHLIATAEGAYTLSGAMFKESKVEEQPKKKTTYYERNREKILARNRARYHKDVEKSRQYSRDKYRKTMDAMTLEEKEDFYKRKKHNRRIAKALRPEHYEQQRLSYNARKREEYHTKPKPQLTAEEREEKNAKAREYQRFKRLVMSDEERAEDSRKRQARQKKKLNAMTAEEKEAYYQHRRDICKKSYYKVKAKKEKRKWHGEPTDSNKADTQRA